MAAKPGFHWRGTLPRPFSSDVLDGQLTIHLSLHKDKLIARVLRIKGQMEGIERALKSEAACIEVSRQIASLRGAFNGLTTKAMQANVCMSMCWPWKPIKSAARAVRK